MITKTRLLKERELRKSSRSQIDDFHGNGGTDNTIGNRKIFSSGTDDEELRIRPPINRQRLLVVANRLPVSATRKGDASWQLEMSVGGLILNKEIFDKGITEFETRWIGWAGVNVTDEIGKKSLTEALADKDRLATTRSFQAQFDGYKKANQLFADVDRQSALVQDGQSALVQDGQFALVSLGPVQDG
ncbi:hypothetical protein L1887_17578 [Cichorium endivia]|nr:hypothetical protein L1887_17578 [Cichorium endivia]